MARGKNQKRYSDEQIVQILQEQSGGVTAAEVVRRHGIALDTVDRCTGTASGVERTTIRRVKTLAEAEIHRFNTERIRNVAHGRSSRKEVSRRRSWWRGAVVSL